MRNSGVIKEFELEEFIEKFEIRESKIEEYPEEKSKNRERKRKIKEKSSIDRTIDQISNKINLIS